MKKILLLSFLLTKIAIQGFAQGCATCGSFNSAQGDTGPDFNISLGSAAYGQSAGNLMFANSSLPSATFFQPVGLQFDSPSRNDVKIIFTSGIIRQVYAPQVLADVPTPPTANGYVINFYYPSQLTGTNSSGVYLTNGTLPFVSWFITNTSPSTINHLQISEFGNVPNYGLMKQWSYTYSTNTRAWSVQSVGGLQENMNASTLATNIFQALNTVQASNGPVVQRIQTTYQVFDWGEAPIQVDVGSASSPQTTTYTYWDPSSFISFKTALPRTISHPDGSWEFYDTYDADGNVTRIYSSFGDTTLDYATNYSGNNLREQDLSYSPVVSGDSASINPNVPRSIVETVQGNEVSRRYTGFPSPYIRLDIQATTAGASRNDAGNLVTTNLYYTSGPNQFALKATITPEHTMTTYDYVTNALYRTNITAFGQPDSSFDHVVDGVSNQVVLNQFGYTVFSASWDVKSRVMLSRDIYGNFDSYGRPTSVAHLDGTIETNTYACCGLDNTIDRDGVYTTYSYDSNKRPTGYQKIFGSQVITYDSQLDAAGRVVRSTRTGDTGIVLSQSEYDLAGELLKQTNALNGVTTYIRTNDAVTGGLIRKTTYPDTGTKIEAYYADGTLKSVTGTAVHGKAYGYGSANDDMGHACTFVVETNLTAAGALTGEWTKTFTDMAGRTTQVLYPGDPYYFSDYYKGVYFSGPSRSYYYNDLGQLTNVVDPDGVSTFYAYDGKNQLAYTAVDVDHNGQMDLSGDDRIMQTTNEVVFDSNLNSYVRRTQNKAWDTHGSATPVTVSMTETSTNGLESWQITYGGGNAVLTNHVVTTYSGSTRTTTSTAPDGSYTVNTASYGRLISSTRYDSTAAQLGGTTYAYDGHGRQYQVTDARNGTITYGYNNADQVNSVTTPVPGGGASAEVTTTLYDTVLRPYSVTQPDGTTVSTVFLLTGEIGKQYGSRTYPVAYSYDYAGRMQTITNWSNYAGNSGARVTKWLYDGQRGWLTSKAYDDGHGPSYTYTLAGRLASRAWVRGVTTSYVYDNTGSLTNTQYSDATPSVTNNYDRLGRLSSVSWTNITDTMTYNLANELLTESFSGGVLSGLSVTNGYDQFLRRTNVTALASSLLSRTAYGYDNASRLAGVNDGNGDTVGYSYLANSPLVNQIGFTNGSTLRMTTTKSYDYLNRLTQIASAPSASVAVNFNYTYNTANQRTKNTLVDGSYWIYQYDTLGQVTGGTKCFADGTLVPGQQFGYQFDDIGNRKQATAGGDNAGSSLRLANYTVNSLNQITQRDYPGTNDVIGVALATNAVTVNGQSAWRKGEYFWASVKSNNTASAQWEGIKVVSGGNTNNGNVFAPKTPEQFGYDADGNLTNDGHWAYVWDGENRLIQMTVNTNVGPQYQLTFAYDAKGRRIQKLVATNGVALSTNNFLYDGWNLIAETRPDNSLIRSYVWGTDLSGTSQGAGGVGGLLEISYYGSSTTNCFPAFDGNGNVAALINAADGTGVANYEYAACGEPLRVTGVMSKNNPFRFSTKYADDESDLLYYGQRFYKASTGTWQNHDPIAESGGLNLYGFVHECPVNFVDTLGLAETLPNPVIPHNWPSGPGPGGLTRPIIPPSPGSGIGSSGGSPFQPPRVPPSAPGKSGKGDTSAGGVVGVVDIGSNFIVDGIKQRMLNESMEKGRANCLEEAKKTGGCCGCCMINLYLLTPKYGEDSYIRLEYNSSRFLTKPCYKVQAEMAAITDAYNPDYRRYEEKWFTGTRYSLDDQDYKPQYETLCP